MREQLELLQKQAEKKTETGSDSDSTSVVSRDAGASSKDPYVSQGSEPMVREQKRDAAGRSWGLGRRKNSSARVYIAPGHGKITINGKKSEDYLKRPVSQMLIEQPLKVTNTLGAFDIVCNVFGGGLSGQAGAVRHAISRALVNFDPDHYKILRDFGYMTRDPRVVERKKPGRPKARKKFQFSKR